MPGWFDSAGVQGYTPDPSGPPEVSPRGPGGPQVNDGSAPTPTGPAAPPDWAAGLDPRLVATYQRYGVTPGGQGSGLIDSAYWNNKIRTGDANYYLNRLSSDFSGSGPDVGGGSGGGSFSMPTPTPVDVPDMTGSVSVPGAAPIARPQRFNPTTYTPFTYGSFEAPTPDSVLKDPGYAFGRDQGIAAMDATAAARGISRTGGAAKALEQFGTDYATTKFDDAYQRAMNTFKTNYGTAFETSQANNAGTLGAFNANTNAALGYGGQENQAAQITDTYNLGRGNLALGNLRANQDYTLGRGNLALGYTTAGNNFALGQGQLGLGYGQLGLGYYNAGNANAMGWANYGLNAQGQQFNQGYNLADLGLRGAISTNTAAGAYGSDAGGLITGAGNAAASGTVGSANALNQGLGAVGNAALTGYGLYYGGYRQPQSRRPTTAWTGPTPGAVPPGYGVPSGYGGYGDGTYG